MIKAIGIVKSKSYISSRKCITKINKTETRNVNRKVSENYLF